MAMRRKVGRLADMLLEQHLKSRERDKEDEIRRGQYEYQDHLERERMRQAEKYNSDQQALAELLKNPQALNRLAASGQSQMAGIDLTPFKKSNEELLAPSREGIDKANSLADMPSLLGVLGKARASTNGDISQLVTQYGRKQGDLKGALTPVAVKDIGPDGVGRERYVNPLDTPDLGPLQTERTGVQEGQRTVDTDTAGKFSSAYTTAQSGAFNRVEDATRRSKARTAGAITSAQESARNAAELKKLTDPRYIKALMDAETRKATAELAATGNKAAAEATMKKQAALEGLSPLYGEYRTLAAGLLTEPLASNSETVGAAMRAFAKLPAIGDSAVAIAQAAQVAGATMGNPEAGKNLARLNKLTDALAMGTANTIFGNKGQVTAADAAAAREMFVNSWTSASSGADAIRLTDAIFAKLPAVAATNPQLTTMAQVIDVATKQVKAEQGARPATAPAPPAPAVAPGAAPGAAPTGYKSILEQRRRQRDPR